MKKADKIKRLWELECPEEVIDKLINKKHLSMFERGEMVSKPITQKQADEIIKKV